MRRCQIGHMHVVADTGAIRGIVIPAKYRYRLTPARGGLQDQRDQVGFRLVAFTQLAIRVSTGGIEVTQAYRLQAIRPVEVLENLLDHPFAQPVG